MSKHDITYINMIKHILDHGTIRKDRTGTGTIGVFSYEMRFDVSDGSIPLLTTKQMGAKTIARELQWFLSGDTNNNTLNDMKVTIWDEWATDTGALGPIYGQMWRNFPAPNTLVLVRTKSKSKHHPTVTINKENHDNLSNIIKVLRDSPRGTDEFVVRMLFETLMYHVHIGDEVTLHKFMFDAFNQTPDKVKSFVTDNIQDFIADWAWVPGYEAFRNDWPTWIRHNEDMTTGRKWHYDPYYYTNEDDVAIIPEWSCFIPVHPYVNGTSKAKRSQWIGMPYRKDTIFGPLYHVGRIGASLEQQGYNQFELEDDLVLRVNMHGRDQIKHVIQRIKTDPTCRRLIVSGWHPGLTPVPGVSPTYNVENGYQALPPCHAFFQFYVEGENADMLSLKLTQRSADVMLGVPYNIAQYTMLLHLVAKMTGKRPKDFIWSGGDVHIYQNHIDGAKEQIQRVPYDSPKLEVSADENTTLLDINAGMFEITGYVHHPKIEFAVAI